MGPNTTNECLFFVTKKFFIIGSTENRLYFGCFHPIFPCLACNVQRYEDDIPLASGSQCRMIHSYRCCRQHGFDGVCSNRLCIYTFDHRIHKQILQEERCKRNKYSKITEMNLGFNYSSSRCVISCVWPVDSSL